MPTNATPFGWPASMDVPTTAAYLSLSVREVNRAIAAGDLPVKAGGQKGGKRLIQRADADAYLANLPDYIPGRTA